MKALSLLPGMLLVIACGAEAGGDLGMPEEEHEHGMTFFGFVKDAAGKAIADAKVVLTIKNSSRIVMRTNSAGMYKVGNLTPDIRIADVVLTCEKDGYKQARVIQRTARPAPGKPVEIECRMARG
jgi:hypothetical protein